MSYELKLGGGGYRQITFQTDDNKFSQSLFTIFDGQISLDFSITDTVSQKVRYFRLFQNKELKKKDLFSIINIIQKNNSYKVDVSEGKLEEISDIHKYYSELYGKGSSDLSVYWKILGISNEVTDYDIISTAKNIQISLYQGDHEITSFIHASESKIKDEIAKSVEVRFSIDESDLSYSIDGVAITNLNANQLLTPGTHTIEVKQKGECLGIKDVTIDRTPINKIKILPQENKRTIHDSVAKRFASWFNNCILGYSSNNPIIRTIPITLLLLVLTVNFGMYIGSSYSYSIGKADILSQDPLNHLFFFNLGGNNEKVVNNADKLVSPQSSSSKPETNKNSVVFELKQDISSYSYSFNHLIINPPLTIEMNFKAPDIVETVYSYSAKKNIEKTIKDPVSFFSLKAIKKAKNNEKAEVIIDDGYGGVNNYMENKKLVIRESGDYLIELKGKKIYADISIHY